MICLIYNLYFTLTRGRTRVPAAPHYTLYCRTDRCRRPPPSGRRSRPRPPTPTIGVERRKMAGLAPVFGGGGACVCARAPPSIRSRAVIDSTVAVAVRRPSYAASLSCQVHHDGGAPVWNFAVESQHARVTDKILIWYTWYYVRLSTVVYSCLK